MHARGSFRVGVVPVSAYTGRVHKLCVVRWHLKSQVSTFKSDWRVTQKSPAIEEESYFWSPDE